ncbi:unnamed protein product [Staurois parvus]|uniref:Uncharacterized protein n=2 Tax=Staurois parvus TaxID=386267 RepID=A0ABN9A873_9NEOB|nr:unnamed protein product [Staurois parvus]
MYSDHQGTLIISVAPAVPPASAHQCHINAIFQCLPVHINATYHCLPVHINATYQCPSELPFSVTHQCQSVPAINAAYQCCQSVPPNSAT